MESFPTFSQKHPSPQQSPPSPSWTLLISRKGLPKPTELFKAQQESTLTPTAPVSVRLGNLDEAGPTIQASLGRGVAMGAIAMVKNPG